MVAAAMLLGACVGLSVVQEPDPFADVLATQVDELVARLRDPDAEAREAAALMLGLAGPRAGSAVPALVSALKDPAPRVRAFAALALADIAPKATPVREALEGALVADSDDIVRSSAAAALAKIASPASVDPLTKALRDVDARTRLESVRALAAIEPSAARRAIPAIAELVQDPDPAVRSDVEALLKKLKNK